MEEESEQRWTQDSEDTFCFEVHEMGLTTSRAFWGGHDVWRPARDSLADEE